MADPTFLHRWSRRKHEAARNEKAPVEASPVPAAVVAPSAAPPAPAPVDLPLPPVESLSLASDFKPFLAETVNETVKRAALRKLFSDPHFNAMDGLDIYIDDYSKPDPAPEGFFDKLADVYKTLEEKAAEAAPAEAPAAAVEATAPAETPSATTDEGADDRRG